jgi:hypothetical protein
MMNPFENDTFAGIFKTKGIIKVHRPLKTTTTTMKIRLLVLKLLHNFNNFLKISATNKLNSKLFRKNMILSTYNIGN